MENLTSWEMRNKAKQMLHEKFKEPEAEERKKVNISYEEAKKAGNSKGMISAKLSAHREGQTKEVRTLAKEYMSYSISDIQSNLAYAKANFEKAKTNCERQLKNEEKKIRETYKNIPMHPAMMEGHVAEDLEEIKRTDPEMIEALNDLRVCRNEIDALEIAKQDYLDTNAELIEEERKRIARETLLKSGVLEELGIIIPEPEQEEA